MADDFIDFSAAFHALTGNRPFPWQEQLYAEFTAGRFPKAATLPTGLGKTFVIAVWLVALANRPRVVPRRLVYVVNRRTVVDQATTEVEKIRSLLRHDGDLTARLGALGAFASGNPLAVSTLRGQFADNAEWRRDPARPAVIVGTVDMIGSRLLFSGYGAGFRTRPLFAGFLGQDSLLVHDEAHLEPAFQKLIEAVAAEQARCGDIRPLRLMALTATARSSGPEPPFQLTPKDHNHPVVRKRIGASKRLSLHEVDSKHVISSIVERALSHRDSGKAILVFVHTVEAVEQVRRGLTNGGVPSGNVTVLTGTMRGLERDQLMEPSRETGDPVFARFLRPPAPGKMEWKTVPGEGTVYLVCTAAGEVGVDISADHLVCDLTPFDSMAQRFGRVNRYGNGDARIDVVHEVPAGVRKEERPFDQRRWLTLELLRQLHGDASPQALSGLPAEHREAAFTPPPTILSTSDILFDAWALTTIRGVLPGRPPVADYLHGLPTDWQPPQTYVAWRHEVELINGELLQRYDPEELLEDYPLKPHELLRDRTDRVLKHLQALAGRAPNGMLPVWTITASATVETSTLDEVIDRGKEGLKDSTIVLAPALGGLRGGMLDGSAAPSADGAEDVADEWYEEVVGSDGSRSRRPRRQRLRVETAPPDGMRLVRVLELRPEDETGEETPADGRPSQNRIWRWYIRPRHADDDGSETARRSVPWQQHTDDVVAACSKLAGKLLEGLLKRAVMDAAPGHDLGKKRELWQRGVGNRSYPGVVWGKSVHPAGFRHSYRHEFGSLLDMQRDPDFQTVAEDVGELVLHLIAAHHGRARPHFPVDEAFDPEYGEAVADEMAQSVPRRFWRLQRRYGRWGLAYLESLLRAGDYLASEDGGR